MGGANPPGPQYELAHKQAATANSDWQQHADSSQAIGHQSLSQHHAATTQQPLSRHLRLDTSTALGPRPSGWVTVKARERSSREEGRCLRLAGEAVGGWVRGGLCCTLHVTVTVTVTETETETVRDNITRLTPLPCASPDFQNQPYHPPTASSSSAPPSHSVLHSTPPQPELYSPSHALPRSPPPLSPNERTTHPCTQSPPRPSSLLTCSGSSRSTPPAAGA